MMPPLSPKPSVVDGQSKVDEVYVDVVGDESSSSTLIDNRLPKSSAFPFGKTYNCQRCLNHGLSVARKGHKRNCLYASCQCDDCKLVQDRKLLNQQIKEHAAAKKAVMNDDRDVGADEKDGYCIFCPSTPPDMEEHAGPVFQGPITITKTRNPKCARCRAHNPQSTPPPLKGHKKACPFQHCTCRKCELVTSRRDVMAQQIRLRRSQQILKRKTSDIEPPPPPKLNGGSDTHSPTITMNSGTASPCQSNASNAALDLVTKSSSTHLGFGIAKSLRGQIDKGQSTYSSECRHHSPYFQNERWEYSGAGAGTSVQLECSDSMAIDVSSCACNCNGDAAVGQRSIQNFCAPISQPADFMTAFPQALFAGFVEYMKSVATAAAVQANGNGLTLPTLSLPTLPAPFFQSTPAVESWPNGIFGSNSALLPTKNTPACHHEQSCPKSLANGVRSTAIRMTQQQSSNRQSRAVVERPTATFPLLRHGLL